MVGGMSLGAASALGALAGAGWSTFKRYGDEIKATVQGTTWQCADENTLRVLYLRQKHLLKKLMHRGHAAQDALQVDQVDLEKLPDQWNKLISALRQNPTWQDSSVARNAHPQFRDIEAKLVDALLDER